MNGGQADEKKADHHGGRQRQPADSYPDAYPAYAGPETGYRPLDGEIPEAAEPIQAAVVQALARAFSWAEILESGQVKSISELARSLEVDGSYVTRILKLTTLAPDIVETIINGEEPDGLSLAKLTRAFPEDWREQRSLLGFSN